MGDGAPTNPAAIDRVMAIVEVEGDDHLTSHWILARKVLGESKAFAFQVATAFRHRKLTREDCERMVDGWDEPDPGGDGGVSGYTDAQLDRAARAVHEVTGGGIPYGKPRRGRKPGTTVHARLVAERALDAATTATIAQPLQDSDTEGGSDG